MWTSQDRSWLFVEVETDSGIVGLGEASQSRNDNGVIEELNRLAVQYIGHDPRDLIEKRQGLLDWPYSGRTFFAAVSALEQAHWDLVGKQARMPVYQLLGGSVRDELRTYANVGYAAAGRDAESLAQVAAAAVAEGHDAVKFYPFGIRPVGALATGLPRNCMSMPYDPVRDFTPVALFATVPTVLVVGPKVEAKSVGELISLAKKAPRKLIYASAGVGTTQHLAGEMLKQSAGIDVVAHSLQGRRGRDSGSRRRPYHFHVPQHSARLRTNSSGYPATPCPDSG